MPAFQDESWADGEHWTNWPEENVEPEKPAEDLRCPCLHAPLQEPKKRPAAKAAIPVDDCDPELDPDGEDRITLNRSDAAIFLVGGSLLRVHAGCDRLRQENL